MGPGPNSGQIQKICPEWVPDMRQNIGGPYQMEDNNKAPSAKPKVAARSAAPLGFVVVFLLRISSETSGFLIGLSLENKLAHNKRPEGSSKPTRAATNPGVRHY